MSKIGYTSIVSCTKKGKTEVLLTLSDEEEDKKLMKEEKLSNKKLETNNPTLKRYMKKGIIRGVDMEVDNQTIIDNLECFDRFKLVDIKRLDMRNRNPTTETKWIPSKSMLLTFEGQQIPREVFIAKIKFLVEPHVPKPFQCHKCFKFDHKALLCKNKEICYRCSADKHEGDCQSPTFKCANFLEGKNHHRSIETQCEVYKKHAEVNVLVAYDNISYREAKIQVFGYPVAPHKTKDHCPLL
ncbi:hypothetical protein TKK_0009968 [Trichogramma kaykai]|uniref:Uncharacterized protein n=1 Tax=Trichogramma kaykai TaxID=54128 RepID=A0ABD2WZ29_9HYME